MSPDRFDTKILSTCFCLVHSIANEVGSLQTKNNKKSKKVGKKKVRMRKRHKMNNKNMKKEQEENDEKYKNNNKRKNYRWKISAGAVKTLLRPCLLWKYPAYRIKLGINHVTGPLVLHFWYCDRDSVHVTE